MEDDNDKRNSREDRIDIPTTAAIEAAAKAASKQSVGPNSRGDPRMQKAVSVKLKNPHCSLSDALHIGGFRYPLNADSTTVDDESVTLGKFL